MKTRNCEGWSSTIELLESRIAPASFSLDHKTAYFIDVDGDLVTVKTTLGTFDDSNFSFVDPHGPVAGGEHFSQFMLNDAEFAGAKITVTAKRGPQGGDGMVNLGFLDTRGVDLAGFSLKGDISRIAAGDGNLLTPAFGTLTMASMGMLGTSTQLGPDFVNAESYFDGGVGTWTVTGTIRGIPLIYVGPIDTMKVGGGIEQTTITIADRLFALPEGTVNVAGNLDTLTVKGNVSSFNLTATAVGTLKFDGSVADSNFNLSGPLATLKVGKNIAYSQVTAVGIGTVTVGGTVQNTNFTATDYLAITPANITALKVGGNFTNSSVFASGDIGDIVPGARPGLYALTGGVKVNGTVAGSSFYAGTGDIASAVIGGDMNSSSFSAYNIGLIGEGAVPGSVKLIGGITVRGSVEQLNVWTLETLSALRVGGDVEGGYLNCMGDVGQIRVAQSLEDTSLRIGGEMYMAPTEGAKDTMVLAADHPGFGMPANLYFLSIGGDMTNTQLFVTGNVGAITPGAVPGSYKLSGGITVKGTMTQSGVMVFEDLATMNVGGDMVYSFVNALDIGYIGTGATPGTVKLTGLANIKGSMLESFISASGSITALTVGCDMVSSGLTAHAAIGAITAGKAADTYVLNGGVTVRGSMLGGSIATNGDLAALKVGRDLHSADVRALGTYFPQDQLTAQTIGAVTVGGRLERSTIRAGIGTDTWATPNGDVEIGKVTVGGDWIASNLVAGVNAGMDGWFGTADDLRDGYLPSISRIAAVTVNGHAFGSTSEGDHFGVVAGEIGAFKSGGAKLPLAAGAENDLAGYNIGPTFDFRVLEVADMWM